MRKDPHWEERNHKTNLETPDQLGSKEVKIKMTFILTKVSKEECLCGPFMGIQKEDAHPRLILLGTSHCHDGFLTIATATPIITMQYKEHRIKPAASKHQVFEGQLWVVGHCSSCHSVLFQWVILFLLLRVGCSSPTIFSWEWNQSRWI